MGERPPDGRCWSGRRGRRGPGARARARGCTFAGVHLWRWVWVLHALRLPRADMDLSCRLIAPCTATLLNLTNQLASLHKLLGTKLLDSRSSIKALRDLEVQIETRQAKCVVFV